MEAKQLEAAATALKPGDEPSGLVSGVGLNARLPVGRVNPRTDDARATVMAVRPYRVSDFETVRAWWVAAGEQPPLPTMMPEGSSFIVELDGVPALAVALYLTNTPEIAWAENFAGNPMLSGGSRRYATRALLDHVSAFARGLGYRRLLCLSEKPALQSYYEEIGFTRTLNGVATFAKEITLCLQP